MYRLFSHIKHSILSNHLKISFSIETKSGWMKRDQWKKEQWFITMWHWIEHLRWIGCNIFLKNRSHITVHLWGNWPYFQWTDQIKKCICSLGNRIASHSSLFPPSLGLCKTVPNKQKHMTRCCLWLSHRITTKFAEWSPTLAFSSIALTNQEARGGAKSTEKKEKWRRQVAFYRNLKRWSKDAIWS